MKAKPYITLKMRTFDEAVDHIIGEVRNFQIPERYKFEFVGMISALQTIHDIEKGRWKDND